MCTYSLSPILLDILIILFPVSEFLWPKLLASDKIGVGLFGDAWKTDVSLGNILRTMPGAGGH